MTEPALEQKLKNSASFYSLVSEQTLRKRLTKSGWTAVQGSFYQDTESRKLREIDVIGSRLWTQKLKSGDRTVKLFVVAEIKSVRGFHFLFSPWSAKYLMQKPSFLHGNRYWMGDEDECDTTVSARLTKLGLPPDKVAWLLKKAGKFAFPRHFARIGRLAIDPPTTAIQSSAFRETNIGGEKDWENSVLWKASMSLQSTVAGLRESARNLYLENLELPIRYEESEPKKLNGALEHLQLGVSFLELYHPVHVTDAMLWLVDGKQLQPLDWCRFIRLNTYGHPEWWFDVVNSDHVEKYVTQITGYYKKQFKKVKASANRR